MNNTQNKTKGVMVSFEGAECSGKSTIAPLLVQHLRDRGYDVIHTREPGGSELAEKLRKLVLEDRRISHIAELLLFSAARADHMHNTILPALEKGQIVICERFADTTFAYQGVARNQQAQALQLEKMVLGDFEPDYTLFFDIPLEESKRRLSLRPAGADRIEREGEEFFTNTFYGYQHRFLTNQHRMRRIDALPALETVIQSTLAWANSVFENKA